MNDARCAASRWMRPEPHAAYCPADMRRGRLAVTRHAMRGSGSGAATHAPYGSHDATRKQMDVTGLLQRDEPRHADSSAVRSPQTKPNSSRRSASPRCSPTIKPKRLRGGRKEQKRTHARTHTCTTHAHTHTRTHARSASRQPRRGTAVPSVRWAVLFAAVTAVRWAGLSAVL